MNVPVNFMKFLEDFKSINYDILDIEAYCFATQEKEAFQNFVMIEFSFCDACASSSIHLSESNQRHNGVSGFDGEALVVLTLMGLRLTVQSNLHTFN